MKTQRIHPHIIGFVETEFVELDDTDVPLAGLPNTGAENQSAAIFFGALGILFGIGAAGFAVAAKKEHN